MDTSAKSDAGEPSVERASRRMRTVEEKLAIVKEASQPGASVALVARKHGVNANLCVRLASPAPPRSAGEPAAW